MNDDTHIASGKWSFDKSVTDVFDKMLPNSVPNYNEMREWTYYLSQRFIKTGSMVLDLGSSRGDAVSSLVNTNPAANFVLSEISEPMIEVLSARFSHSPNVKIIKSDLRKVVMLDSASIESDSLILPYEGYSLVTSILTLMFVPIEYRQEVMKCVYDCLEPGGAFILVEKTLGKYAYTNKILIEEYLEFKRRKGYTEEQIQRKKLALEGVLVPAQHEWNERMLEQAGFQQIETYWKSLMFSGIIAIKE